MSLSDMMEYFYGWFVAIVTYLMSWIGVDLTKRSVSAPPSDTEEVAVGPLTSTPAPKNEIVVPEVAQEQA